MESFKSSKIKFTGHFPLVIHKYLTQSFQSSGTVKLNDPTESFRSGKTLKLTCMGYFPRSNFKHTEDSENKNNKPLSTKTQTKPYRHCLDMGHAYFCLSV